MWWIIIVVRMAWTKIKRECEKHNFQCELCAFCWFYIQFSSFIFVVNQRLFKVKESLKVVVCMRFQVEIIIIIVYCMPFVLLLAHVDLLVKYAKCGFVWEYTLIQPTKGRKKLILRKCAAPFFSLICNRQLYSIH